MESLQFQALNLAVRAHDNQRRKTTYTPYIEHPVAVGFLLTEWGCSPETISAGILHDVLEDCLTLFKDELKKLNKDVYRLVKFCSETKSKDGEKIRWKERKEHTISTLSQIPIEALCISLADKYHNLFSMYNSYLLIHDKVWGNFNAGREDQKWYYTSLFSEITKRKSELPLKAQPLLERSKEIINKLFQ